MSTRFPIPASLQDLERHPYNLLPYPNDFDDDNEAARAQSFDQLVELLEDGNKVLTRYGVQLFLEDDDDSPEWIDTQRMQALYTLARKSASLANRTRSNFISALCRAVHLLCNTLSNSADAENSGTGTRQSTTLPQCFRDAFACHIYMLFSVMSAVESEIKVGKGLAISAAATSNKKKGAASREEKERKEELAAQTASRNICTKAMLAAAQCMNQYKFQLWKHGVVEEDLLSLPCQISYLILENCTNTTNRKSSSGDEALSIIASTAEMSSMMSNIVAALMDLMHTHEHISPLIADLCSSANPRLAMELFREIGRIDGSLTEGKASGIKFVAPFISELALRKPQLVLAQIGLVLSHLNSESYVFRSSIVTAIGFILTRSDEEETIPRDSENFTTDYLTSAGAQKTRDSLFDMLTERVHDVSSYTRAAALKAWVHLIENSSVPTDRFMCMTKLAIDRLQDKTIIVRKNAMQLLTLSLENNLFMGSLNPSLYERKVAELKSYLTENVPERVKNNLKTALGNDEGVSTELSEDQLSINAFHFFINEDPDTYADEVELFTKLKAFKFASSALEFIDIFERANDVFYSMLLSSNSSDVTEAIRFFVRARHFDLPCAVIGMKQALSLMWSSEQNIRDEVLKGFVDVFIASPGTDGTEILSEDQIVQNLIFLVSQASVSELASIEEAVRCLVKDERIPAEVFSKLWSTVANEEGEPRASAMLIIAMGAGANPSIVDSSSRLRILLEAGLGEQVELSKDWRTVRAAACALQQIGRVQALSTEGSAKSIVTEFVIEQLCVVARGDWCREGNSDDTKHWFCAAEQAIDAIFVICDEPEKACSNILRGLEATTFGVNSSNPFAICSELRLSRFFFVIGHVALKLLVYTESLSSAVNRANALKSLKKQEEAGKSKKVEKTRSIELDDEAIEKELGVDAEAEAERDRRISEISEKEIVGRGLIGLFGQLLVRVIDNEEGSFSSDLLRQSATLALCKFMCISNAFCEKHLPLLFSTVASDTIGNTILQANVAVAIGDLAFRFPNAIEPYTPRIYAFLKDPSSRVRRHTLMVLTHLILNDMVKVKGQVCEIALCLEDKDPRIRDMSRLLFHELSKRSNNPIYNLLPEIISRLSQIDSEKLAFRSIMAFLLSFIKKEKQNEVLVEKICQRFPTCSSISQKSALAFCLAHVKVNEKCIKILNDSFKLYKDALFDEEVFKWFTSIAAKARTFAKLDIKDLLEEWEGKLKSENENGMENQIAGTKAKRAKERAVARNVTKSKRLNKTVVGTLNTNSEDEDELEKENSIPKSKPSKKDSTTRTTRRNQKARV